MNGLGLSRASIFCYLPFEIGIILSRMLNLNYMWAFTISNMFGLIFYAFIIYLAIYLLPMGKWILFLIAQFPLALSMATSFTYDIVNYALLTLIFALFCGILYGDSLADWKRMITLAIISVIVLPIKIAYIPFCLFIVLIPSDKFAFKYANIVKIIFACICVLAVLSDKSFTALIPIHKSSTTTEVSNADEIDKDFDIYELYKASDSNWQSTSEIIGDKSNIIKYTYNNTV